MKKILIVVGSESGTDYNDSIYAAFAKIKTAGHRLFLLSDESFTPRSGIFDDHFSMDLRKTQAVLEYMKKVPIHFDAVTIKTSEWLTTLVALLAQEYGCIGNEPFTAFCCRSKYHMRQKLSSGNIPIPKFVLCHDYDALLSGIQEIGFPCILKPVGGNSSYGTFLLRDEKDLQTLPERYAASLEYLRGETDVFGFTPEEMRLMGVTEEVNMITDYLVEEFMAGPEISVDALVQNGQATIMGIEDQIRMKPPYMLQMAARFPYQCSPDQREEIENLISRTITALGIQNSATHTEIIFTKDGPKIVEIACRVGGDDLHDTILHVTGYNMMYESILIALGVQRSYTVSTQCHTMMEFFLPPKAGTIRDIHVPKSVQDDPDVYEFSFLKSVGSTVDVPPRDFNYLGYVAVKGSSPENAAEKLQAVLREIQVVID